MKECGLVEWRAPRIDPARDRARASGVRRARSAQAFSIVPHRKATIAVPTDLWMIQSGRAELSWSVDGPAVESNERTGCEDGGRSPTPTTCRGRAADAWRPPRDRCAEPSGAVADIRDAACVAFGTTAQGVDIRHRATVHRRSRPARR